MNKLEITKTAVSTIVGAGAAKIVHAIVQNNIEPEKTADKVAVTSGSVVLGMMTADMTKQYTDAKIDQFAALVNQLRNK